jgi:hypothetical protein
MKKKTVIEIGYHEFEEIVAKAYGLRPGEYEFVFTQECGNDSSHEFEQEVEPFDPNNVLDKYDLEKLAKIKSGDIPQYTNHIIFRDLVNRGILEPGAYIVQVSW